MKLLAVIPARFASTRFPGKPLADILGKPMVQWVYEQVLKTNLFQQIIIATENEEIFRVATAFGAEAMMTSHLHPSGTDRIAEVLARLNSAYDYVVNIQGDEPLINPLQIEQLVKVLPGNQIASQYRRIAEDEALFNPSQVKVVINQKQQALYFSRWPIPYQRGIAEDQWLSKHHYYAHVGLYGYQSETLARLVQLPPSALETSESLEQLRWLENGFNIQLCETKYHSPAIDHPEDLERLISLLKEQK